LTKYLLVIPPPYPESPTIRSREDIRTLVPGDPDSLEWFLYHHVPAFTAARKIRDGIVDFIESLEGDRYVKHLLSGWTPRFAEKVVDTVRRTAAFGALDLMMNGDPAQAPHRDLLLSILKKCDEFGHHHYEHEVAYGRAALLKRDFAEARRYRQSALAGAEGDAGLSEGDRKPMRAFIERHLPEAELAESRS
jgi:hypothetical protein